MAKIKDRKKKKLSDLAGSWKMSDEEAKEFLDSTYKERKIKSRRL